MATEPFYEYLTALVQQCILQIVYISSIPYKGTLVLFPKYSPVFMKSKVTCILLNVLYFILERRKKHCKID